MVRRFLASQLEKHAHPEFGVYYYNRVTGTSSWYKPLLLGSDDIPLVGELAASGAQALTSDGAAVTDDSASTLCLFAYELPHYLRGVGKEKQVRATIAMKHFHCSVYADSRCWRCFSASPSPNLVPNSVYVCVPLYNYLCQRSSLHLAAIARRVRVASDACYRNNRLLGALEARAVASASVEAALAGATAATEV